jgi:hypothetical protein
MDKINRGKCVADFIAIAEHFSITPNQVMKLIGIAHGIIPRDFTPNELTSLITKRLMTSNYKVNTERLFKPLKALNLEEEDFDVPIVMDDDTPNHTELGNDMLDKLFATFVIEDQKAETYINYVAKKYFLGNFKEAKAYIVFGSLFPKSDLVEDRLWNAHFGITFEGKTKWEDKSTVRNKFSSIYRRYDIGMFLAGTYYAVKNSIDYSKYMCYMSKVSRYLTDYEQWITYAEKQLKKDEGKATAAGSPALTSSNQFEEAPDKYAHSQGL